MRNPVEIAPKLSLLVGNSSLRRSFNIITRNFAARSEKSSKRRAKKPWNSVTKNAHAAMDVIYANKSTTVSKGNTLYLLDEMAARKFASLIIANRATNSSHIVEINSGLGLLTKELLAAGIPSIQMYEGIHYFLPALNALRDKHPNKLSLESIDFYHLWNLGYTDWKECSEKMDSYFKRVEKKKWKEEPAVEIIGSLANMDFIYRLVATVVFQNTLSKYGRMVLYVAVPPSVWAHLNCTNEHYDLYRTRIIMFQTLFRCELLGQLPRSVFYPNHKKAGKCRSKCRLKIRENDENIMHVVKIEARSDIFMENFTVSDMVPFYYFVNHHLKARTNRVIPALENWIPGCGRTLIAQGYNIFTEFGELPPWEILKLFKEFRSWPDYKKSSFISCMDTFLMRMDEHIVFDASSEHIDDMFELSMKEHQDNEKKSTK